MEIGRGGLAAAALLIAMSGNDHVRADEFYKGNTISLVVGATPGAAFDTNARTLARYLPKYIPGNPLVVVRNMPGAGSMTAIRYVDAAAPKDGTVVGIFLPGIITQSIVTPEKVPIDFSNVTWLGVVSGDYSRICYGFGPNGIRTFDDLIHRGPDKPFIMGTTGTGASNYINGMSLKEVFGGNVKVILGFPGSSEIRLAVERGELEGDCGGVSSLPPDWIGSNKIHPFVRFAKTRGPGVPESAVYVGSFVKTSEQQKFLNFLYDADGLGRPYIMSNQTPPDRVAVLRTGFNAVMKDPNFIADLEKLQETVAPLTGEEAERVYRGMRAAPQAFIARARKLYE